VTTVKTPEAMQRINIETERNFNLKNMGDQQEATIR